MFEVPLFSILIEFFLTQMNADEYFVLDARK
jgi:hypothetical protein